MSQKHVVAYVVGLFVFLQDPRSRDEHGLSQSTENALLLAGAATIAGGIIIAITAYVNSNLPK